MSVERAKEFLVELAENDEAADRVDAAYLEAMGSVAGELGYDVSDEDLVTAIVEMTGLSEQGLDEVSGFQVDDTLPPWFKAPSGMPRMFGNPLGFQPRKFGM